MFILANRKLITCDDEANTKTVVRDVVPINVRVTNPIDGFAILLLLSPLDYVPGVTVLTYGGTDIDPAIRPANLSSQFPAT